jgi:hypothetical protein
MTRLALTALAALLLTACGNEISNAPTGPDAPIVAVLRDSGVETVMRGRVRANPDGSSAFSVSSTEGRFCRGLFGASGNGLIECDGGPSTTVPVPAEVYGQPSGSGVVRAGTTLIGFGWGDQANPTTVRALF